MDRRAAVVVLALLLVCIPCGYAQEKVRTFIDPTNAPDYYVQGEYEGRIGSDSIAGVQVVALGDGRFDAVLYDKGLPGGGWGEKTKVPLIGIAKDGIVVLSGTNFSGQIKDGALTGMLDNVELDMKRVERQSPTMGAKPPAGAIVLFDGTNTDEWVNGRIQEGNVLAVGTRTKRKFKDYTLHVEFRSPYQPYDRGQARGNSGMYLNDQYEFQILDSFGLKGENNECGGYYSIARPAINMCLPPLQWQTYDVEFTMARFDDAGNKTKPAVATVKLNGYVIHNSFEIPRPNGGGGQNDETKPGSIFFQDHSNPVHFRNVWIVEK